MGGWGPPVLDLPWVWDGCGLCNQAGTQIWPWRQSLVLAGGWGWEQYGGRNGDDAIIVAVMARGGFVLCKGAASCAVPEGILLLFF